jgi:hypothetical protein
MQDSDQQVLGGTEVLLPVQKFLFDTATPSAAAEMPHLAVAAIRSIFSVFLLWTLKVMVAMPAPDTSWGRLTVDPDVAKMLAVVTLHRISLSLVGFNFYNDIGEGGKAEGCCNFWQYVRVTNGGR